MPLPARDRGNCLPLLVCLMSANACVANMCLHNPDALGQIGVTVDQLAVALHGMLWGKFRLLEFFDASSWPFTVEDVAVIVAAQRHQAGHGPPPTRRPWAKDSS